jgi:hypothetical protein
VISLHAAMVSPDLLGGTFGAPSWATWRVVAKVLDGERLGASDLALFARLSGRTRQPEAIKELYCAVGRRGGKSLFTAGCAIHASALTDYSAVLAPGQRPVVAVVASTADQARVLLGYIAGLCHASEAIEAEIVRETASSVEFANGNTCEVHVGNFRTIRGRTFALVLLDELAFLRSDESALPDVELRRAALPGLLPGGRIIGISSPWARRGLLYQMHARHYGQDASNILVLRANTLTMNPLFDAQVIADAEAEDIILARTEYGGQFREDLQQFLDDATIDRSICAGVSERAPLSHLPNGTAIRRAAFADLSGGRHDWAAMSIAHPDGDRAVQDAVRMVPSPHSPQVAIEQFAAVLKQYKLTTVTADGYAGNFATDEFAKHGINCVRSELDRSGIYLAMLPMFAAGRVDLLDHPRLIHELRSLERLVRAGGRERVDHPPSGHDDVVNASLGALQLVSRAATLRNQVYVHYSTINSGMESLTAPGTVQVLDFLGGPPIEPGY